MERDYKKDIKIDFLNMHENWREQADNFLHWAEKWVNAIDKKDKRKQHLSILIRDNPEEYNLKSSPSEASIQATIASDSEYIQLNTDINTYSIVKEAFNHRRNALEALTKLYLNGYFQGVPEDIGRIKEEIEKEKEEKAAKKQKEGLDKSATRLKKTANRLKKTNKK